MNGFSVWVQRHHKCNVLRYTCTSPLLLRVIFCCPQAFLFTITNHATRYTETLVTRYDSTSVAKGTCRQTCSKQSLEERRRGVEVGASLLVVETSGGRSSCAKTPGALEDEENCTHGDSPENGSRAP